MRNEPASATPALPDPALPVCDTNRRFVRLTEKRADGLVAFDFAIGWPELSVELLLPAAAFADFCRANRVERLDDCPTSNDRPTSNLPDHERRQDR